MKSKIFEKFYKRIELSKENSYYSMKCLKKKDLMLLANKLMENILEQHNAKEHHQSFIRKKHKVSKTIKSNYLSTKNF